MDNRSRNNDITIRIRRHQSLPVQLPCHPSPLRRRNTASSSTVSSVLLINRRLGATKNNPYIGSFRHAPPTSLRSMEATSSSLSSLSSAITARIDDARVRMQNISTPTSTSTSTPTCTTGRGRSSSLSSYFSPSLSPSASSSSAATLMVQHAHVHVPAMKNSPYVGWFRHAPPSSMKPTSSFKKKKQKKMKNHPFGIHKVDLDSLTELDRWHDQLSSLLKGVVDHHHHVVDGSGLDDKSSNSGSYNKNKIPLLVLNKIINGRLVGGSGKDQQHKKMMMPPPEMMHPFRSNDDNDNGNTCNALSRLTSWLQQSIVHDDDDDESCSCIDDHQKTGDGLKLIDDDDDDDSSHTSSSTSSYDYDPQPVTARRRHEGRVDGNYNNNIKAEIEKEFSEMNVSASEIEETYYAHQQLLIDDERDNNHTNHETMHPLRSTTTSRGIRGVDHFTSTHYDAEYDPTTRTNIHRLDYEITQMDIARMARNASRHLDVDSILTLPTIIYRRNHHNRNRHNSKKKKQQLLSSLSSTAEILPEVTTTDADQSYHHVCTPINEDHSNTSSSNTNDSLSSFSSTSRNNKINDDSSNGNDDKDDNDVLHSTEEEGWSFLMVNGVKSMVQNVVMRTRKDENKNKDIILSQHQQQQIEGSDNDAAAAIATATSERKNHNEEEEDDVDDDVDVDDVCVICLEVFRDGDRLRVLPCDHSFHAGCIDRWLSGSHSYNACFTAGCPTCKKLPHSSSFSNNNKKKQESTTRGRRNSTIIVDGEDDDKSDDSSMTGSVPSWAFANLGSVMAMSSGDLPYP